MTINQSLRWKPWYLRLRQVFAWQRSNGNEWPAGTILGLSFYNKVRLEDITRTQSPVSLVEREPVWRAGDREFKTPARPSTFKWQYHHAGCLKPCLSWDDRVFGRGVLLSSVNSRGTWKNPYYCLKRVAEVYPGMWSTALHKSFKSVMDWVGHSKLINGLMAAANGTLVCWRPSLLLLVM